MTTLTEALAALGERIYAIDVLEGQERWREVVQVPAAVWEPIHTLIEAAERLGTMEGVYFNTRGKNREPSIADALASLERAAKQA